MRTLQAQAASAEADHADRQTRKAQLARPLDATRQGEPAPTAQARK